MPYFYKFMICLPPSLALLRQAIFSECRCLVFPFQNTSRSEWFTLYHAQCTWPCHLNQTSFMCNYVLLLARVNKTFKQEESHVSVSMKRLWLPVFHPVECKVEAALHRLSVSFSRSPSGLMSGRHAVDFPLLLLMLQILSVSGMGNIIPVFHWAKMHKYLWCVSCKSLNIQIWQITYSS